MPDIAVQTFCTSQYSHIKQIFQPASVEAVLTHMSKEYDLNPHFRDDWEHEALIYYIENVSCLIALQSLISCLGQVWSRIEGGLQRSFAQYCMTRFQRNSSSRLARGCWRSVLSKFRSLAHTSVHLFLTQKKSPQKSRAQADHPLGAGGLQNYDICSNSKFVMILQWW